MSDEPAADELQIDLRQYVDTILRRRWAIIGFFVATVSLVTLFTLKQRKIYQASATVIIEAQAPQVLGNQVQDVVDMGSGSYWYSKEYYETQYNIIKSRSVAQMVVDKLGLAHDDAFLGIDKIPDVKERERIRAKADPVELVRARLKVDPVRDSRVVNIRFEDSEPDRAARVSNAIVDAYVQQNLDRKVEVSRSAADWLQNQLSSLKDQLEQSETRLFAYKKDNDLVDLSFENRQSLLQQKLASISDALSKVQQHKAELEAKVQTIQAAERSGDKRQVDSLPEVAQNQQIAGIRAKLVDAQVEYQQLQTRYGPSYPKLEESKRKIESLSGSLEREVRETIDASINDYRVVAATEANLVKLLESAKRESFEVNQKEMDYKRLQRDDENNLRLYEVVLKRLKDIDLSGLLKANNVYKLDAALVPSAPIRPRVALNILWGAVLGLLGGIALAFFLEYQDSTVATQEEVERRLGLPVLGLMPMIKAAGSLDSPGRDLFVKNAPKSSVAECCRVIRTNLNFMSTERPLRSVLVTSAGPQEGKTTSLVNLGVTIAQSDKKVLLLDTDMRRPRLHRSFKVGNERGLSTLIAEGGEVIPEVRSTEVPGLYLLPSGPVPPNPAELLHTERFRAILDELSRSFDRVLLDSPPVGAVTDALVLSTMVDGVLVVLKAHQTDRGLLRQTLKALGDVRAKVLGGILNNVDLEKKQYGYYQGYYYGYGKYYGEPQSSGSSEG